MANYTFQSVKYFIYLFLIICIDCNCQNKKEIKESGKDVNLFDNSPGKYTIEQPDGIIKIDTLVLNKPMESDSLIQSSKLNFGVWFNNKKWSVVRNKIGKQEFTFTLTGRNAWGMIASENKEIPIDNLVDNAFQAIEIAAPDNKIIRNESRRVNGSIVRFLQLEVTIQGNKCVYLGYYCTFKNGSIQFITYTEKKLLAENRNEMETLLNGLVRTDAAVKDSAITPEGFEKKITINENAFLQYNKKIDEAIPTQIIQFMSKHSYINPELTAEIYLTIENNAYKLKFVKEESILSDKEAILAFNSLEMKLNSNLKLNKELVIEFTNEDLTKTFALPRGKDIVNKIAEEIFKLKIYDIDNFHSILHNKAMPFSELNIVSKVVKRLRGYFPEDKKIDLIFLNNGSDYTLKLFVLKQYWNMTSVSERGKWIVKYLNDSGIRKKINIMLVDFTTYEEIKI
ncbi:MAG: hypothetical protein Q8904_15760 [Bacteroidota bacterium]|nr:hypothetical protein [Bacteroidota bacterium]